MHNAYRYSVNMSSHCRKFEPLVGTLASVARWSRMSFRDWARDGGRKGAVGCLLECLKGEGRQSFGILPCNPP